MREVCSRPVFITSVLQYKTTTKKAAMTWFLTKLKKLLARHEQLVHSERCKVNSHVQRAAGEWILNTILIDGYDVPFRYKRKRKYKSLAGASVNLTYYPSIEDVGGFAVEVMKVVRIRKA